MSAFESARARGALWVKNYARHYGEHYAIEDPWAVLEVAHDLISDALHYADDVVLRHHLPSDGSADILERIAREFPALSE